MTAASAFKASSPRTAIYVDGFNLYYGCLKGTPFKWLDIGRLCTLMLPGCQIQQVKYFTAEIRSRPEDPDAPIRQSIYLRALRTIHGLEIIPGHFRAGIVSLPLAEAPPTGSRFVRVVRYEEKGSDVNLATHLVHDGHRGIYDLAVVVSNDSDLGEALRIVRTELNVPVGLLNPHRRASSVLKRHATFYKPIRTGVLQASQFPRMLHDDRGAFGRPHGW